MHMLRLIHDSSQQQFPEIIMKSCDISDTLSGQLTNRCNSKPSTSKWHRSIEQLHPRRQSKSTQIPALPPASAALRLLSVYLFCPVRRPHSSIGALHKAQLPPTQLNTTQPNRESGVRATNKPRTRTAARHGTAQAFATNSPTAHQPPQVLSVLSTRAWSAERNRV